MYLIYFRAVGNALQMSTNPNESSLARQQQEKIFRCYRNSLCTSPNSLEEHFSEEMRAIDLTKKPDFQSYLVPNETNPIDMLLHLQMDEPGLLVSTGTERALFSLLMALLIKPS
jgi:hypothetical protein